MTSVKLFHGMIVIHKYLATYVNGICHVSNTKKSIIVSQKTVTCSRVIPKILKEGSFKPEDDF